MQIGFSVWPTVHVGLKIPIRVSKWADVVKKWPLKAWNSKAWNLCTFLTNFRGCTLVVRFSRVPKLSDNVFPCLGCEIKILTYFITKLTIRVKNLGIILNRSTWDRTTKVQPLSCTFSTIFDESRPSTVHDIPFIPYQWCFLKNFLLCICSDRVTKAETSH